MHQQIMPTKMTRTREQEKQAKKAKKTTKKITHAKWTTMKMKRYMKDYCHDAKKEYLDEENFKKAAMRLMTRTGWKL